MDHQYGGEIELHTLHNTVYKMSGVKRRRALTVVKKQQIWRRQLEPEYASQKLANIYSHRPPSCTSYANKKQLSLPSWLVPTSSNVTAEGSGAAAAFGGAGRAGDRAIE